MKRKLRKWKMWAGYLNDELDVEWYVGSKATYGAIYPTRPLARKAYHDVRPVEVRELPRKK